MGDVSNAEEVMVVLLLEVLEALEVSEGLVSDGLEGQVFEILLESSYSSNLFWSRNKKRLRWMMSPSNAEEVMEVLLLEVLEALEVSEGLVSDALEGQVLFGALEDQVFDAFFVLWLALLYFLDFLLYLQPLKS